MRIGILTFHWATNYGAVLQCFALQFFLESRGHNVKVINYKPRRYDDTFLNFLRTRQFLNIVGYLNWRKKELELDKFRNANLHQTKRVFSFEEMESIASEFDVIVSGSDQVVNPFFLMNGEGRGKVSPTYFLGFQFNGRRIGYALSFGCVTYPDSAREIACRFMKNFDVISVREKTGVDIVKSMGRDDASVVPDPTLLMEPQFYHTLANECLSVNLSPYIYSFFIRHISRRKSSINEVFKGNKVLWNNEDGDYTMQGWISKINNAEFVVTDSFHCVVMCLKLHKPFAVITEYKGNVGMNDRLYSLLDRLFLSNHIVNKENIVDIMNLKNEIINWSLVDDLISQSIGVVDSIFE